MEKYLKNQCARPVICTKRNVKGKAHKQNKYSLALFGFRRSQCLQQRLNVMWKNANGEREASRRECLMLKHSAYKQKHERFDNAKINDARHVMRNFCIVPAMDGAEWSSVALNICPSNDSSHINKVESKKCLFFEAEENFRVFGKNKKKSSIHKRNIPRIGKPICNYGLF